jgi:hypothetical protein
MKLISSTAIALVAGLIAAPAAAQMGQYSAPPPQPPRVPQAQPQQPTTETKTTVTGDVKPSAKAVKALIDLQKAVEAKDAANIPAKIAAANAVASTKEDHYWIGKLELEAALNANDTAALATAIDTLAASGYLEPAKVSGLYRQLGAKQFNAKQYALAVGSFQRATALTPNDPEALELLAQGQAASQQDAAAAATFQRALQARTAAGQKPAEDIYRRAVQAAYNAKTPAAVELAREWLAAYPSPDAWQNSIAVYLSTAHPDSSLAFDLLRLKSAAAAMHGSGDYYNYASAAIEEANYGEAKAVISEGLSSGKINASDSMIQQVQAALKGKAAPTAAELATAEQTAKVPTAFLRVGDRYYGAGNYQKAADLYREGLAKGADANLANLRLGEALARAGDKAGAVAAFNKVGGSYADIAKFWLVYVQRA